jgi:hypothetical protein
MYGHSGPTQLLQLFLAARRKDLEAEISQLEINSVTDTGRLLENPVAKYLLQPLALKDPVPQETKETTREMENHWGDRYKQKVFNIYVNIPFEGSRILFDCRPSTCIFISPSKDTKINHSFISVIITMDDLDVEKYKAALSKEIYALSANIPAINEEIAPWNNGLEDFVKKLLETRQGIVTKRLEFMEQIGLKKNPDSDQFMLPPPVAKKTVPPPTKESARQKSPSPVLANDVYDDIINVLHSVGCAMERKPSLYAGKNEEAIRDAFLLFLETRYESTSGASEAFNKKGATDILLKYAKDGSNIFVAECKFWRGPKSFLDVVTQLLGYLTHRDTKTALLMFCDQKNFTAIKQSAAEEIKNHPYFKRKSRDRFDTSASYIFGLPQDSSKEILLEVLLFHFIK